MNLFIRVDCDSDVGFGHLIRCWAIGEAAVAKGFSVRYIVRRSSEILLSQCTWFTGLTISIDEPGFEDQLSDASSTLRIINGHVNSVEDSIVLVDSYSLGAPWRAYLAQNRIKLVLLSDEVIEASFCDLLINQNVTTAPIQAPANVLLGSRYVCLHPDLNLVTRTDDRQGNAFRVLVSFGGADPTGMSIEFVKQVPEKWIDADVTFYLFPGAANKRISELNATVKSHQNVVLCQPEDYISKLVECDLAIGSAGVSLWERLYLGVPSVVLTTSAIQSKLVGALESIESSLIVFCGEFPYVDWDAVNKLLDKKLQLGRVSTTINSRQLVDGKGPKRIASKLLEVSSARKKCDLGLVRLNPLRFMDIFVLRNWRNSLPEESTKKSGFKISLFSQIMWYATLKNKHLYFIMYHKSDRVGSCFLKPSNDFSRAETGLLVGSGKLKGSGVGLLGYYNLIVKAFYEIEFKELEATVKKENISAVKMNKFYGFQVVFESEEYFSMTLKKEAFGNNRHLHEFMTEVRFGKNLENSG